MTQRASEIQLALNRAIRLCVWMYSVGSSIDAADWKEFTNPAVGFQVLMPGTARLVEDIKETPAGNIELNKFIVEPKDKKEMFMVLSVRFPDAVGRELGGPDKLLELGRQDLLAAAQGQIKSEKQIVVDGHPGLEMEVLPAKGAIVKARVFATKSQIFQIWAHVPLIRLASDDVQKFLDSFKMLAEAGPPPGGAK